MDTATTALKPRKSPVQARSTVTVEALHTAAIQVLTREGLSRCTTTRIAERAGMSVGSVYQYYPNRDALLSAVLETHLEGVAAAIEGASRTFRGKPIDAMAVGLVSAFLAAKLRDPQESKALYAVSADRGGPLLVQKMHKRMLAAIATMLESAPDARFDDPAMTSAIAFSALVGPVRTLLDGHVEKGFEHGLETELVRLLTGYLGTHRLSPAA